MALVRLSLPGKPIEYIDIGQGRARVGSGQGGVHGSMGGPFEYGKPRPSNGNLARIPTQRRPLEFVRCGKPLRRNRHGYSDQMCGRRAGHRDQCRSAESVERDNARRRTRDFGA